MALLPKQAIGIPGADLTGAAASGGGDTVLVDRPGVRLIFRNGDASAKTVTLVFPGNNNYGSANPDPAITVAAGKTREIPLPMEFGDSSGIVSVTYSAVTSCTVDAVYG